MKIFLGEDWLELMGHETEPLPLNPSLNMTLDLVTYS